MQTNRYCYKILYQKIRNCRSDALQIRHSQAILRKTKRDIMLKRFPTKETVLETK